MLYAYTACCMLHGAYAQHGAYAAPSHLLHLQRTLENGCCEVMLELVCVSGSACTSMRIRQCWS